MKLPNLSYLGTVSTIRYMQNRFESPEARNPDDSAGLFLSAWSRTRSAIKFAGLANFIRKNPWYWYVLARTFYYDDLFLSAVFSRFSGIVNIGCGADSRSLRFRRFIDARNISVAELDQPEAIRQKQRTVPAHLLPRAFQFGAIDLNTGSFDAISAALSCFEAGPVLIMMEGVSPYIDSEQFRALLVFLAGELPYGSILAYDYKISGVNDGFGKRTMSATGFRLSDSADEVYAYHEDCGLTTLELTRSRELCAGVSPAAVHPFCEDSLLKLSPISRQ